MEDAAHYESPFEYVREAIMPIRLRNRDWQRRTYCGDLAGAEEIGKSQSSPLVATSQHQESLSIDCLHGSRVMCCLIVQWWL